MSRPGELALQLGLGTAGALGTLALLHQEPRPAQAALCAGVAVGFAAAVHPAWRGLPRYVTAWLDAGVIAVAILLGAVATVLGHGAAYVVLRGPELAGTLGSIGLLGSAVTALAYTHHRLAREVAAQEQRVAELRERALQSHLTALSAQLNPHFLFNTLNTLAEVVHEDADTAEALIADLAGMMRYVLRSTHRWGPLRDELDVIRRTLRLATARFGDRLRWSVTAEDEALDVQIPGLLVQPLVENALKHAVSPREEGGRVDVRARCTGGRLRVEVEDDGPGLPPAVCAALLTEGRGTAGAAGGLYTTAERARLAWEEGAGSLSVEPTPAGTRLVLEVPA